jgi:signal transduction histidine kinase/CheY-like chemotaxis protein
MSAELSDQELDAQFVDELISLQCTEAARPPYGVVGVASVMAVGAWSYLHPIGPVVWVVAIVAALIYRIVVIRRFFAGQLNSLGMGRWLNRFSLINGFTMGLGVMVFMHWYTLQWQAVATIFLLGLVAGSMPASAMRPEPFKIYTVTVIAFLAAGWVFFGKTDALALSIMIAILCVAYLSVFVSFIQDAEAKARVGFKMRYENLRLLNEVKLQQIEITRERDIAQKANLAKSRFLASASHDLRQPLQTISMYNAALSLRPLDEQSMKLVKSSGVATTSLASLLNALLDVSQLDANSVVAKISDVDLSLLSQKIHHEFSQLAIHKDRELKTLVPSGLIVRADPILLERVLRNLLDNALKHGAKSIVMLSAHATFSGKVVIVVADDGGGIPEHELEAIFEEFYQLKNAERDRTQGLGLGLPIVRRLCQLMNATCVVTSNQDDTKFTLEFAVGGTLIPSEVLSVPVPELPSILLDRRILVFDDELEVRESVAALLQGWGCVVDTVGEDNAALLLMNKHKYLALLIDYRLRNGRSGLHFVARYGELLGTGATILITGDLNAQVQEQAESLGVPVMRKPIDPAELKRTLEDIATL